LHHETRKMHRMQTVARAVTFFVIVLPLALTINACSGAQGPTSPSASWFVRPNAQATATSLDVAGFTSLGAKGERGRLSAMVTYSDGNVHDRSSAARWLSSNESVATVDASGMVTAVSDGRTTVTATFENLSGTRTILVDLP
jgi:Big-like domain-containing protein